MSDWGSGYVTDVAYIWGVYRELTPAHQSFATLLRGLRAPSTERDFTYCELGFGQGLNLNLLAAIHPNGDFWGTDFNPTHAINAQDLATTAQLGNVHVLDRSFAEFLETPTPDFDFISLHGVYAWISDENRRIIVEILNRKLKPGGLVYVSYNALPGWASAMPLHRLLIDQANRASGSTMTRIGPALAYLKRLKGLRTAFFNNNPGLDALVAHLAQMPRNYVAHEYLNEHWNPQYFADVARDLGRAKLSFAASAILRSHVDFLNFGEEEQKLLAEIDDPVQRETICDFLTNQTFRRDIFIKGTPRLSRREHAAALRTARFVLTVARPDVPLKAKFEDGEIIFKEEIYAPILDALAKGPRTVAELLDEPDIGKLGLTIVMQALVVLAAGESVAAALPAAGEAARRERTDRFNALVLEHSRYDDDLRALASPVAGTGINVERYDRLIMLGQREGAPDLAAYAWARLQEQGEKVLKDGKPLTTIADSLADLRQRADKFATRQATVMRMLGVT
jgi:SAM-dependent methyltransferase